MPSTTKVTASASKATKGKAAKKTTVTTTKPAVTKTAAAGGAAAPASTPTAPPSTITGSSFTTRIEALQADIATLSTHIRTCSKQLTAIQKEYTREKRQWERQAATALKKKKTGNSGTVSGIAKPGYISPELCKFIGKDVGTEMARTEVIKHVNSYIKEHGLQDAKNKRIIRPDSKLQSLLKTKKSDEVTYFNLQTFMKRHYANPAKSQNLVA